MNRSFGSYGSGNRVGPPFARPVIPTITVNTASSDPQISSELSSLQSSIADLQEHCSFNQIVDEINDLDTNLNKVISLLETVRSQGYRYQGDIDERAYQNMDHWPPQRDQATNLVQQQANVFANQLIPLSNQVQRLNAMVNNPNAVRSMIPQTRTMVTSILDSVGKAESNIHQIYSDLQDSTSTLTTRLNQIQAAYKQLEEACFKLRTGEDLVMAVPARWDKDGKDDPEGVAYLTDQRLIFEQKQKVATKKVLFVTVAAELVQQVLIDQPKATIQSVKPQNRGLLGHEDFIDVQFNDPRLGLVMIHLKGQPSKQWAAWVEKVCNGTIESERVAAGGASLKYEDLTSPMTTADLMALQSEVNGLQQAASLVDVRQELATLENDLHAQQRKLADVRAKGYAVEKNLEADLEILSAQWDRVMFSTHNNLEEQTRLLNEPLQGLQRSMAQLMGLAANPRAAQPIFLEVKSTAATVKAKLEAAQAASRAPYSAYAKEIKSFHTHLEQVSQMQSSLATASFKLMATETGIAAVPAVYTRPGMGDEKGVLVLTDMRLLWERKGPVSELVVNAALQQITNVQKEVAPANGSEFLNFSFAAGADFPSARFTLESPVADEWMKMVGRARSGDFSADRAVQIDPAEVERIRNAPKQCSNCGAAFTKPILRGQSEIICEYCGVTNRF